MKLPPLNALRAFEAAARHNGYIAAADELHVTRGAISRHIKMLEEHLGVQLFHRNHKGVDLTVAGRQLLPVLTEAFEKIARETGKISTRSEELRIICPPALSIRWLFPRLEQFRLAHPDITVRLTTDFYSAKGLDTSEYDLGISVEYSDNRAPDIAVQPFLPMTLSPACAPDLLDGPLPLAQPADLAHFNLLHESPKRSDWAYWLKTFDIAAVDPGQGEVFPNLDMATKAATLGGGIVMADLELCKEELERGTLVLPFPDMTCKTPQGDYALIGSQSLWDTPKVRAFRHWAANSHQTG